MSIYELPQRKHIRLAKFNYNSAGNYFITFCTQNRLCLFGNIVNGEMQLNDVGKMVNNEIATIKSRHLYIDVDTFVVMPNHIHAIFIMKLDFKTQGAPPVDINIPNIIKNIKTFTTNAYIRGVHEHNWPSFYKRLWQRNYYEHIIRDEISLKNIRQYIINNPLN